MRSVPKVDSAALEDTAKSALRRRSARPRDLNRLFVRRRKQSTDRLRRHFPISSKQPVRTAKAVRTGSVRYFHFVKAICVLITDRRRSTARSVSSLSKKLCGTACNRTGSVKVPTKAHSSQIPYTAFPEKSAVPSPLRQAFRIPCLRLQARYARRSPTER